MQFKPGDKVAHQVATRPNCLMLGKVMPDGGSVLWQEMVDHNGVESNRNAQGIRPGKPVPLKGDEQPCPPEFAHLVK